MHSLKAIHDGCPLNAERDLRRKVRRFQAVMPVGPREAEAIATYATPEGLAEAPRGLGGAEKIQGKTEDFLGVAFLETAVAAASSVARVAFRDHRPQGTGFMVSDRLFLTNHHVITGAAACQQFVIEFDYQLDYRGQPRNVTRFALAPDVFFLTSPEAELDFTLVAVGRRLEGAGELGAYGYIPLLARDDKHVLGELVNVIQHPEGNFKQTVIRQNQLVARLDTVLHYVADTMPGSSGSPVFNDQWEVIALHHWGEPFRETMGKNGKPVRHDVNEGVRISAILARFTQLRAQLGDLRARSLLDTVLKPKVAFPSRLAEAIAAAKADPTAATSTADGVRVSVSEDGRATWTVPLQVSVNLGSLNAPRPPSVTEPVVSVPVAIVETEGEKVVIDRNYSNRQGYNPKFLPGFTVPFPKLSAAQKKLTAKLKSPVAGADPHELKYTHFSLVMNKSRRMAFFTASNIDGATWININRKENLPAEAAEATETWYDDPRIDAEVQCEQRLYDQDPPRAFDRGHLVRRQDPAWGTQARAVRANADTFHFANCTPQAVTFNESAKFWQGIERYILEQNAVADKEKVTVFTGPVFDTKKDVPWRYVKVPRRFWKIVVRVQDGKLAAIALLADQSQFLKSLPEGMTREAMEAWDNTAKVKEYLSTVREVEKLTGLNFGELRKHDTKPGGEAFEQPLTSFEQIPLHPRG